VITDPMQRQVVELETKWPLWQIWAIRHAVSNEHGSPTTFCARRWDGRGLTINADTAGELDQRLQEEHH
jgi:hypothetical protein